MGISHFKNTYRTILTNQHPCYNHRSQTFQNTMLGIGHTYTPIKDIDIQEYKCWNDANDKLRFSRVLVWHPATSTLSAVPSSLAGHRKRFLNQDCTMPHLSPALRLAGALPLEPASHDCHTPSVNISCHTSLSTSMNPTPLGTLPSPVYVEPH